MENCANFVSEPKTTTTILYLSFMGTNHWLTQMLNLGQLSECQPNMTCWLLTLKIFKGENPGVNNGDSRGRDPPVGCREPVNLCV
jgi:hypothetical protein